MSGDGVRYGTGKIIGAELRGTVRPMSAKLPPNRGAYHAIAALPAEVRAHGVITPSSGNHGQAVAYAAARFGIPAVVVIPNVAPAIKVDAVRRLGAEVVLVDGGERLDATERLAAERDLTLIPPFDHPDVIAGQGTVGVEILADLPTVDLVLVPVGGGGLASGVSAAAKAIRPRTAVYGVEPDLAPDARDSLAAGRIVAYTSSGTPPSPTGCAPRCPS